MVKTVISAVLHGMHARKILVELNISNGFPCLNYVGLADVGIRESKERVRAALENSDYDFPHKRITVNFLPATFKKEGSHLDLAISIAMIDAIINKTNRKIENNSIEGVDYNKYLSKNSSQNNIDDVNKIDSESSSKNSNQLQNTGSDINMAVFGELSLNGDVVEVQGIIPLLLEVKESGIKDIIIPKNNLEQAKIIKDIRVYPVDNLKEAAEIYFSNSNKFAIECKGEFQAITNISNDMSEVHGQHQAKRVLEIAAAGMHNVLLCGSPGSGKSMLAKRINSILPDLTYDEAIELSKIYSASNYSNRTGIVRCRAFRTPHHSISAVSMCGGGKNIKAGEISLAHRGVLFLDEFAEFSRSVIESIRQPIEDKYVQITRTSGSVTFPCDFLLIAAYNPCPCGYLLDKTRECVCSMLQIQRYKAKLSGPILDRFDLQAVLTKVKYDKLRLINSKEEKSSEILKRVKKARNIQKNRFSNSYHLNSNMSNNEIKKHCKLDEEGEKILRRAYDSMYLTGRSLHSVLKISRTIADLDGSKNIKKHHLLESLQYRRIDKMNMGEMYEN